MKFFVDSAINLLMALPFCIWSTVFFILPCFVVAGTLIIDVGISEIFAIASNFNLGSKFLYTLSFMVASSLVSLSICSVLIYFSAKSSEFVKKTLFFVMLLVSQISFIARCYAYRIMLSKDFFITLFLKDRLGIDTSEFFHIYSFASVFSVSCLLMISVIYASLHQSIVFDVNILLAAEDLGAGNLYKFFHVFLPSIKRPLISAYYVAVAYCSGLYFVPEMIGTLNSYLLGTNISDLLLIAQDVYAAMIFAIALLFATFIAYFIGEKFIVFFLKNKR